MNTSPTRPRLSAEITMIDSTKTAPRVPERRWRRSFLCGGAGGETYMVQTSVQKTIANGLAELEHDVGVVGAEVRGRGAVEAAREEPGRARRRGEVRKPRVAAPQACSPAEMPERKFVRAL